MSHSPFFHEIMRTFALARWCERNDISPREGLERRAEARDRAIRRRTLLGAVPALGAGLLVPRRGRAAPPQIDVDVAIVGAGMAGLACADTLADAGVLATLYEARDRLGGRQWSMGGAFAGPVTFPGQVVERGGELIDNLHLTMLGYAKRFKLAREDMGKQWVDGEVAYHFNGQAVTEAEVLEEFHELVGAMHVDLAELSAEVTAFDFTEFDQELDYTSLHEYLVTRGAGPHAFAALDAAYTIEYGCEIDQQSALNMLFFIHADRRSRFTPFGVFSDERWHVIGGNQQIAESLASELPGPIVLQSRLLRVARLADGRVELTFNQGGTTVVAVHDAVVLALPAPELRDVELHASLELPPWKQAVIDELEYGANAKLNVGFNTRIWGAHGSDGVSYSDLPNHQCTWEVNPINATANRAVLLDYSGGDRAAAMNPQQTQKIARDWLDDLDKVYPGAKAAAVKVSNNQHLAHLQHWPSDPNAKGAYTCNHPGYFTTLLGYEPLPIDNVYFAGEHTDSFYEWQGFMEGAANSGIRAAEEILADFD
jgi:monoamine oxidase